MFFDWFFTSTLPDLKEIKSDDMWKSTITSTENFSLDKLIVSTNIDGSIKVDVNGVFNIVIPADSRHEFLKKVQIAVNMANVADPGNKR